MAVGTAAGVTLGAMAAVLGNTDIVMPTRSKLPRNRGVMSHEYGHYMLCSMMSDSNPAAVDHLVWGTMLHGNEVEYPLRYTNEAFAEFFEGQVASGADYPWLQEWERPEELEPEELRGQGRYCSSSKTPCWESNLNEKGKDGRADIGRIATLLLDLFDGQPYGRRANVPTDADAWLWDESQRRLVYNPQGDSDNDSALERVELPARRINTLAHYLTLGMVQGARDAGIMAEFRHGNYRSSTVLNMAGYACFTRGRSWVRWLKEASGGRLWPPPAGADGRAGCSRNDPAQPAPGLGSSGLGGRGGSVPGRSCVGAGPRVVCGVLALLLPCCWGDLKPCNGVRVGQQIEVEIIGVHEGGSAAGPCMKDDWGIEPGIVFVAKVVELCGNSDCRSGVAEIERIGEWTCRFMGPYGCEPATVEGAYAIKRGDCMAELGLWVVTPPGINCDASDGSGRECQVHLNLGSTPPDPDCPYMGCGGAFDVRVRLLEPAPAESASRAGLGERRWPWLLPDPWHLPATRERLGHGCHTSSTEDFPG